MKLFYLAVVNEIRAQDSLQVMLKFTFQIVILLVHRKLHLHPLLVLEEVLNLGGLCLVLEGQRGDAFILDSRDVEVLYFLALKIIHQITHHGLLEAVNYKLGSLNALRVIGKIFHLILLIKVHLRHHLLQLL